MKPLFTLKKGNTKVDVIEGNGMICFTRAGQKEWIIKKDLHSFTEFYINNGYSKLL